MAEEKKEASVSQETVKTEGQKPTGKEKEREEKKDWRVEEVDGLKRKFRLWRGVALSVLSIDLAIILFNWLSPQNLPISPRVLYWLFVVPLMGWYISHTWKIVKAWERGVVFTLGRMNQEKNPREPGLRLIWWPIQKIIFIQMWERKEDLLPQKIITLDLVEAIIDILFYWKVTDACEFITKAEDPIPMASELVWATLRNEIGSKRFKDVIAQTGEISEKLIGVLKAEGYITEEEEKDKKGWGLKITTVKVQRVIPPPKLSEWMENSAAAMKEADTIRTLAQAQKDKKFMEADATKYTLTAEAKGKAKELELKVRALGPEGAQQLTAILVAGLVKEGDKFFIDPQAAGLPLLKEIFTNVTKSASQPK